MILWFIRQKKYAKRVVHLKKYKKSCDFEWEVCTSMSPRCSEMHTFFWKCWMYHTFCKVFYPEQSFWAGVFSGFWPQKTMQKAWDIRKNKKKVVISCGRGAHRCHHAAAKCILFLKSCICIKRFQWFCDTENQEKKYAKRVIHLKFL